MHDPDHHIIRRILAGETRAYAMLIDRHKGNGMTVAIRMLKNREDAEEALQDAFVRAFRALQGFAFEAKFSTWFYRILYNVCASALERRNSRATVVTVDASDTAYPLDVASHDAPPDVDCESREFHAIVAEEIARLPAMYATVLTLFLLDDCSYREIADITGMPIGTVKTQLFRARRLLRTAVQRRVAMDAPGTLQDTK